MQALAQEGLKANFHQLDIEDKDSIKVFAEYLKTNHGGLDVLVNNAGVFIRVKFLIKLVLFSQAINCSQNN